MIYIYLLHRILGFFEKMTTLCWWCSSWHMNVQCLMMFFVTYDWTETCAIVRQNILTILNLNKLCMLIFIIF